MTREERTDLLRDLANMGSRGRAEGEDESRLPKTFFPVAEHLRALDPEVVLVVGPRGAGKTEVFRTLTDARLASHLPKVVSGLRVPTGQSDWIKGYPLGKEGFDASGLRRFADEMGSDPDTLHDLWFAYLVRAVRDQLDEKARQDLAPLLSTAGGSAIENWKAFRSAKDAPLLAIDRLDDRLEKDDRFLFLAYDELDIVAGHDWQAMTAGIRGLVALWAAYTRRWKRLRAKLFLRSDLYERYATVGGADLAKLAASRVELVWSERSLYAMLVKRIANTSERLSAYIKSVRSVQWVDDVVIGALPELRTWEDARPVVEKMLGPYMGANVAKGHVYRWLLDHIRDGRGRALPRPLVRLVETAADIELSSQRDVRAPRILHPVSLRRALDSVSLEHVEHSRDEWPWLEGLKSRLAGEHVPWDTRREVERIVGKRFDAPWASKATVRLPADDPREFVDYLLDVGVLRARPGDRIDAPDLFLSGLGLKRKGGAARR